MEGENPPIEVTKVPLYVLLERRLDTAFPRREIYDKIYDRLVEEIAKGTATTITFRIDLKFLQIEEEEDAVSVTISKESPWFDAIHLLTLKDRLSVVLRVSFKTSELRQENNLRLVDDSFLAKYLSTTKGWPKLTKLAKEGKLVAHVGVRLPPTGVDRPAAFGNTLPPLDPDEIMGADLCCDLPALSIYPPKISEQDNKRQ